MEGNAAFGARFLMEQSPKSHGQEHRQLLAEEFRLRDGPDDGEHLPTHPSQPYYVIFDEVTGEILLSLEDRHEDHPLNLLADLRAPREDGEAIFFFHVPKVRVVKFFDGLCLLILKVNKLMVPSRTMNCCYLIYIHNDFIANEGSRRYNEKYYDKMLSSSQN